MTLDYRATAVPGDSVTVLGGRLKPYCAFSDCACWPLSNASGPVRLEPPDAPLTPVAVFVGSQYIGSCSDIDIDLTTSIGSGGRDWAVAAWNVTSSLPDANLSDIRAFLATWNLAAQVERTWHIRNQCKEPVPSPLGYDGRTTLHIRNRCLHH